MARFNDLQVNGPSTLVGDLDITGGLTVSGATLLGAGVTPLAHAASHAVGQGAVIWVLISEIFPNRHRAEGQALGCFTHWIFAALLTTFFPKMVTAFAPGYVFLFFCGMMVLQLIWVKTMVPETKGVSLEKIQEKLGLSPVTETKVAIAG